MPRIAGHQITDRQLAVLHALYQGLVKNGTTVYGVDVTRQLAALADAGLITRGGWSYTIPWGGPAARIIVATPDFPISSVLL